jgi:hypothetical protein
MIVKGVYLHYLSHVFLVLKSFRVGLPCTFFENLSRNSYYFLKEAAGGNCCLPILVSVVLHGARGFIFGKSLSILSRRKQVAIW